MSEQDSNPPVSTGGGDDGTTTLLGSGRIGKDDPRIVVLGDVDEASSFLGLARAEADEEVGGLRSGCSASSTASWATWRCRRRTTRSARMT